MTRKGIALFAAATLACGGGGDVRSVEEAPADTRRGATAMVVADAAPGFPARLAQDPCLLVGTDAVARWTGTEVRRLEARLPIVDERGRARAACVAFPVGGAAADVPVFEIAMRRPAERAPGPTDATPDGVALAVVEDTAFELRCERCGDRIGVAMDSIVTSYESLME